MAGNREARFNEWLGNLGIITLPDSSNVASRALILARELGEGAINGFWETEGIIFDKYTRGASGAELADYADEAALSELRDAQGSIYVPANPLLRRYLRDRWGSPNLSFFPEFQLLLWRQYLTETTDAKSSWQRAFTLMPSAFDTSSDETAEPASVFISYKRSESSAFALLVLARLKEIGLKPFVDLSIEPGTNWKRFLEEEINKSDFVVVLLGPKTLESDTTQKEIVWAYEANKVILPIWHGGFRYVSGAWNVMDGVDDVLSNTHTIIVQNESAGGYNAALAELLNRFGFTP